MELELYGRKVEVRTNQIVKNYSILLKSLKTHLITFIHRLQLRHRT